MNKLVDFKFQYVDKSVYPQVIILLSELNKHSHETYEHSLDVYNLSAQLGEMLGLSKHKLCNLCTAAVLHDIGKLAIPTYILESPNMTISQRNYVKYTHVKETIRYLIQGGFPQEVIDIASHHHEKVNGSGYPKGLRGNKVSFEDQILIVADHTSAILMTRSYKSGKTTKECATILDNMAKNNEVDKKITDCMVSILNTRDMLWQNPNNHSMSL
ncbi:MAG: HD domain-containing protein [Clostridia bacterium]|nr:HD domain-containing protein [Clostridia bacterium]